MKYSLHDLHVHELTELHQSQVRYTPEMSGTSPIVRKSTIPFAVRGLRNSSKYLDLLEKLFPKSRKTRVSLSSNRILLPPISFTPP